MSMIARQSMTVFMLAVFSIMVGTALTYPEGARFMPLTVGIPGILLCCLQIALDFRKSAGAEEGEKDEIREAELKAAKLVGHDVEFGQAAVIDAPKDQKEEVRREIITWGYFLGFLGGVLLFGFWVSIPIFLLSFLKERAGATWTRSITLTCIASTAFYFIFAKGLGVSLYTGMITGLIMDRIAG
jgi:uncharacterized membrane protein YfcA